MNPSSFNIQTADNFTLACHLFSTQQTPSKGVILFNSGTCIKKEFYRHFCAFLAEQGYTVIAYDYRGVGESLNSTKSASQISILHWAQQDMVAMINWIQTEFPTSRLFLVAHSMGGQVIGLTPNIKQISKIATICSSYGNWHFYLGMRKYLTAIFVQISFPIFNLLLGYIPLKWFKLGENIPKGVAKNIIRWSLWPQAHSHIMDKASIPHHYPKITQPMKAFFMADDPIATHKTIPYYQQDFSKANLQIEILHPSELQTPKIGHLGFFSKRNHHLWDRVIHFIETET